MCTRNGAKRALGYTFHHVWLSALLNSLSCMPVELPLPFTQITKKADAAPKHKRLCHGSKSSCESVSLPSFPMVFPKSFSNFWVVSNASYVTTLGRDGFFKGQTAVNEQDTIIIKRGSQAIRRQAKPSKQSLHPAGRNSVPEQTLVPFGGLLGWVDARELRRPPVQWSFYGALLRGF